MQVNVKINKGFHRGIPVSGTFPLVTPYKEGAKGGYLVIRAEPDNVFKINTPRISVMKGDFTLVDSEGQELSENHIVATNPVGKLQTEIDYEKQFLSTESEQDAMKRIRSTFSMVEKLTDSVAKGVVRGLIISGPAGVGKSWSVEEKLREANNFNVIKGKEPRYEIISGSASAIGLYQKLYDNRAKDQVICFDDCDSILFDDECLNLLKAALNSGERRRICWNKESRVLGMADIPDAFDFEGGVIFLTNIDFENTRASRIKDHLNAIMSRCHYLDLEMGTMRDRILRIKQIVNDGMLSEYGFADSEEFEIIDWVEKNQEHLREVSLRTVKKVADFKKEMPNNWEEFAEATVLTREAKFKRLMSERN
jgi:hypothetical protein